MTDGDELAELRAKMARDLCRAMYLVGEDLLGRATRLAPIEEGTLRGSGAVVLIVNGTRHEGAGGLAAATAAAVAAATARRDYTVNVEVSFNTIYAAAQHEGLDFEHPLGGQAKYLEQPFREQADRYIRIIQQAAGDGSSGPSSAPPAPPQPDIPF